MSRPFGDDDPMDRPGYFDDEIRFREEYREESTRQLDEKADEMQDLSDLF